MRKFPEKFLTIILTFVTYGPTNMSKTVEKFAAKIPGAQVEIKKNLQK